MNVEINKQMKLSQHFTLGELCKTSVKTADGNIPSHVHIENLKRLTKWLEMLREEWNRRYADVRCQKEDGRCKMEDVRCQMEDVRCSHEEPIIINSGYRSPQVNKAVGGAATSNHLTGCAADIRCEGKEQAIRYACILLDISEESQENFDELLIEQSAKSIWVHFAVRPEGNRRKIEFLKK